ncbi:MAG: TIGR03985 family CRISPR-associated protein [Coleofasciculus sp. B1-GNL1-01]|uniref:TIGR03985 family CRISPR-associated protein n=1 Tax=Coleofasciculus sp. B1-GNL1-01 TaxID=3068484 RepID=UPI0032F87F52
MSAEEFLPTVHCLETLVPELLQVSNHPSAPTQSKNCLTLLACDARRWVMIRSLYDRDSHFFIEFETELFNCADWLKKFKEKVDHYKTRSFSDWLFPEYTESFTNQFIATLKSRYTLEGNDIDKLLSTAIFSATDRTLRNHLTQLSQLKTPFLERQLINPQTTTKKPIHKFRKRSTAAILEPFTTDPNFSYAGTLGFFTNDVSTIAQLLFTKINGEQRLFIHHDYVVKEELRETSADLADRLKEIWQETPTPPLQIAYHSASLNQTKNYTIYPVCLYYYQRAYYLCAFGQRPHKTATQAPVGWYNYRLERISKYQKLPWDTPDLPFSKSEIINHPENYAPAYIQQELDAAYGFDFYEKSDLTLLRFDADFAQRYIDNSFRHPTFEKLDSYQEALVLIEHLNLPNPRQILAHIHTYSDAAYYALRYRHQDNTVIMRLRAWGPKVEVMFPNELRQRMRQDIEQTWQFYQKTMT